MSESATHDAIEAVARNSYGRLVACIASRTGDIADAQDALSEALVAALETWPRNGGPDKPEAWLLLGRRTTTPRCGDTLLKAGMSRRRFAALAVGRGKEGRCRPGCVGVAWRRIANTAA
jgi:predicted RNA polymerase sigma factor